jgi:hypothetical protein
MHKHMTWMKKRKMRVTITFMIKICRTGMMDWDKVRRMEMKQRQSKFYIKMHLLKEDAQTVELEAQDKVS